MATTTAVVRIQMMDIYLSVQKKLQALIFDIDSNEKNKKQMTSQLITKTRPLPSLKQMTTVTQFLVLFSESLSAPSLDSPPLMSETFRMN